MTLYKWSQTPASNASADSTINWAEGQAPSSVNDSARAMMTAVSKYRDDISGAIVTTGTATAYAVTTNQVFDTLPHMNGAMIAFTPHTTNGAGPVTLATDAVGTKPLRSAPSTELLAGVLVQGTPYVATYNNSDAVWYLQNFYGNPYNIPLGGFLAYAGASAPNSSFVLPFGQAISRTTYATLFSLVASTYGAGDGSTTFNIPDLRGRGIFFKDNMGGSAANRITVGASGIDAVNLSAAGGTETHTLTTAQIPSHTHTGTTGGADRSLDHTHNYLSSGGPGAGGGGAFGFSTQPSNTTGGANTSLDHLHSFTTAASGGGGGHQNMPPAYILNCIMRVI